MTHLDPDWQRLLPDAPFRFHLGVRPGDAARFFAPTSNHKHLIAERDRCLRNSTSDHCRLEPEGYPLLEEAARLADSWGCSTPTPSRSATDGREADSWLTLCSELGRGWEPDFLLLAPDTDGQFRLRGGVVCFPSSWSLEEKMGRTVPEIHDIVPTLNENLGHRIDTFLQRIVPGSAWERANWGLSNGDNLNRHPKLNLPPLDEATPLDRIHLRVEHQIFFRLPRTLGLLFGIRLSLHPLRDLIANPAAAASLRIALETMPDDIARYKGLANARSSLLQVLA